MGGNLGRGPDLALYGLSRFHNLSDLSGNFLARTLESRASKAQVPGTAGMRQQVTALQQTNARSHSSPSGHPCSQTG